VAAGLEKLVAPGVDVAWDGETAGEVQLANTLASDPGGDGLHDVTPASATAHFTLARLVRMDVTTQECTVEVDASGSTVVIPTSQVLQLLSQAQVQELRVAHSAQVAAARDGVDDLHFGQGGSVGDDGGGEADDRSDTDDDIVTNDTPHEDGGQSSSYRANGKPDHAGNKQKLRQLLPEIPVSLSVSLEFSDCVCGQYPRVSGHLPGLRPLHQWQFGLRLARAACTFSATTCLTTCQLVHGQSLWHSVPHAACF
jgi:hypothetical protein